MPADGGPSNRRSERLVRQAREVLNRVGGIRPWPSVSGPNDMALAVSTAASLLSKLTSPRDMTFPRNLVIIHNKNDS